MQVDSVPQAYGQEFSNLLQHAWILAQELTNFDFYSNWLHQFPH